MFGGNIDERRTDQQGHGRGHEEDGRVRRDFRPRRRVLQRHQNDAQPLSTAQLEAEVDETLDALKQRDKLDSSREVAPLVPAEDAVHVDSTAHTIDEVVSIIEDLINQRR